MVRRGVEVVVTHVPVTDGGLDGLPLRGGEGLSRRRSLHVPTDTSVPYGPQFRQGSGSGPPWNLPNRILFPDYPTFIVTFYIVCTNSPRRPR